MAGSEFIVGPLTVKEDCTLALVVVAFAVVFAVAVVVVVAVANDRRKLDRIIFFQHNESKANTRS